MRRLAVLCVSALCFAAGPALATGDIFCEAPDRTASVVMGVGHLPVLSIFSVEIEAGGRAWSTNPSHGEEIAVGQGHRDHAGMAVDFTDPDILTVVAELRTLQVTEGSDTVESGWLRIPGVGAWVMVCMSN